MTYVITFDEYESVGTKNNYESDISELINNSDLNEKTKRLATEADLNAKQDKLVQLKTHDLSYFLCQNFFDDDGFQTMFL